MNIDKARQILTQSITNLEKRKGGITQGDLEAEVINNACLAIIKNQNEKMGRGNSIREILLGAINSSQENQVIASSFIGAARELLPEYFSEAEAESAMISIEQNLSWDGMWDFLTDYFRENHGMIIEDDESIPVIFFSERQETFEDGILLMTTEKEKTIFINFSKDHHQVTVKIDPDLPLQEGILTAREGRVLKYKNKEKHYFFTIHYDEFNEVKSFVFEDFENHTEIFYYE